MSTKAQTLRDPRSCWNRADDNEPVFVLLGRDKSAAVAIRAWIQHRLISKKSDDTSAEIITARREADEIERFAANREWDKR